MGDYQKLKVWQRSRLLAGQVYLVTKNFPSDERFGLIAQMRRAVVSIMSNLAEGSGRGTDRELIRFAMISRGSARELESQVILAIDLCFGDGEQLEDLRGDVEEICRMLTRLTDRLRRGISRADCMTHD